MPRIHALRIAPFRCLPTSLALTGAFALTALFAFVASAAPTGRADPPASKSWLPPWLEARERALPLAATPIERSTRVAMIETIEPLPGPWDDSHWVPRFGLPVPDQGITTLLPYGDRLVVGGSFSRIGELEAPGIAAWDGTAWSRLGEFPATNVWELALQGDGVLALSDNGLWRWRGIAWEALPEIPGSVGYTDDIAVHGDSIAISVIAPAGTRWQLRVLLFMDGQWTQLGQLMPPGEGGMARLAWYRDALYAGGYHIDLQDPSQVEFVKRWTGNDWETVGTEAPGTGFGGVWDLEVHGDELIAGGSFSNAPDYSSLTHFARWDGTRWTTLGEWPRSTVAGVSHLRSIGGDLYAGGFFDGPQGRFGVARWDGARWHVNEDRLQPFVRDLAYYGGYLYVGGSISREGTRPATPLMRREGDRWNSTTTPSAASQGLLGSGGGIVNSLVLHEGGVVAAGHFDFVGGADGWTACRGVARWDGVDWSPVGSESFQAASANGITLHQGALHVVGYFDLAAADRHSSVLRFQNGEWVPVGEDVPFLNAYAIASAHGDLFVGGLADGSFGGVARWDGLAWRSLGSGITRGGSISEITSLGADVIFAGAFEEIDGIACRNIAAWNPVSGWRPLGQGLNGPVHALLSIGSDLYVTGPYIFAGGGIARWGDGEWHAVPSRPSSGGGSALGWHDGRLVVSGRHVPSGIAVLENGEWQPLGTGLNGEAYAIQANGKSLFVGGFFSRAGSSPSYGFAEWRAERLRPVLSSRLFVTPNPTRGAVGLRYDLTEPAIVRLEIFDLAGKQVQPPILELQSPGSREWIWTPPAGKRPGIYFARVTAGGASHTAKIVRIH